jgi:hypothetical protein
MQSGWRVKGSMKSRIFSSQIFIKLQVVMLKTLSSSSRVLRTMNDIFETEMANFLMNRKMYCPHRCRKLFDRLLVVQVTSQTQADVCGLSNVQLHYS